MTRRPRDRSRYDVLARGYEALLQVGSLGSIERLYEAVADALDPLPGGTLVELGCGPATVTPHLLEKIGPSGALVGVDLAEGMVIIHLKAPLVGERPTRAPLDFASARLEAVRVRRLFLGAYTVVSGGKPRAARTCAAAGPARAARSPAGASARSQYWLERCENPGGRRGAEPDGRGGLQGHRAR